MRAMHIQNYSLPFGEDEIRNLWFGVISAFQLDNSRGQFSIELDVSLIPFDGVEMGPIIGKGSFGSVFKATWSGRVVAIKVICSGPNKHLNVPEECILKSIRSGYPPMET